ncbi:MAG: YafY family protein [Ardenticatenaceae bacterium]|nr:YafY family protein [Ardenticatenaceae bacterium]
MKASRLITLLMLLQTQGRMTAKELAARLEVSTRTIYRDIDALSAAGVPVYAEPGAHGGCALVDNYRTSLTGLNEEEVRALFMSTVPSLMTGLGADKSADSARLKLTAALPPSFQKEAQRIQQLIFLDPVGWLQWDEPTPFLPLVQEALWEERRVRMLYRTAAGTWNKRLVAPYGLVAKGGIWYLVAESQGRITTFRISRIQEAALTGHHYSRPNEFDLKQYWEEWVTGFEASLKNFPVEIRVPPTGIQPLIEVLGEGVHQIAARTGRLDRQGNLFIEVSFGSAEEACRKLSGLGHEVEVMRPPALRQMMSETARKVMELYGMKTRDYRRQTTDERQETRDERRETRDERRETRDERRETRDERRETRDEAT